jgi:putative membrane protein
MRFLVNWLITAAALWFTAWLVPGITVEGTKALLLAALVIGLINAIVKPVLVFLTFPVTLLTLGIFYLVLNGLLFYLAAALTPGFRLSGFAAAFFGALVLSVVGLLLHAIVPGD